MPPYAAPQAVSWVALILAAFIQLGVAGIAGYFLLKAHDRQSRLRLQVDYRLKMLEQAHGAAYEVTSNAMDGAERLAEMATSKPGAEVPDTAWRMRQTLRKAATHLPPSLSQRFDDLLRSYTAADNTVATNVKAAGPLQISHVAVLAFRDELDRWENAVREWKVNEWGKAPDGPAGPERGAMPTFKRVVEACALVAGVVGFILSIYQALESARANELAAQAQRAWISATRTNLSTWQEGIPTRVSQTLTNSGPTPALDVRTRCAWRIEPPADFRPDLTKSTLRKLGLFVPGVPVQTTALIPISAAQIADMRTGAVVLYMFCEIQYRDTSSNTQRVTHFCFELDRDGETVQQCVAGFNDAT